MPRIEPAGPQALPEFLDVVEEAGAWLMGRGIPQWPPGSSRAQAPWLRARLRRGTLLLARDGGRIAGGCLVTLDRGAAWADRDGPGLASSSNGAAPSVRGYLYKLAVARAAAGRGLGARIVAVAEAWGGAAGLACLRLDCWDGNDRLRAFYRDLGYRELDAVPEHDYLVRRFEKELVGSHGDG